MRDEDAGRGRSAKISLWTVEFDDFAIDIELQMSGNPSLFLCWLFVI